MQTTAEVNKHVHETGRVKIFRSPKYNYNFDKVTGYFERWGGMLEEDPQEAPAPEIMDLEISKHGCPDACNFCYKNNKTSAPINMTLKTFEKLLAKMPRSLTQIAFGIGGIEANPEFMDILWHTREQGIAPNFTLSGMDLREDLVKEFVKVIGAVAISAYEKDPSVCYRGVKWFTDHGLQQTNIHLMISDRTLKHAHEVLHDRLHDPRLAEMNAIVFLGLKPKGRGANGFTPLPLEEYQKLVRFCLDNEIRFGFDSCSAPKFEQAMINMDLPDEMKRMMLTSTERCEASVFSSYINVTGDYWHCSFTEKEHGWMSVNVLECDDFVRDIWNSPAAQHFRSALFANKRACPVFPVING